MHWFTTTGEGGVKAAGTRPGKDSANGNAVMFDAGKILAFGGSEAFAKPTYRGKAYPARNDCSLIEINKVNENPKVTKLAGMKKPRVYLNSVVLPDGKIFATGGSAQPKEFNDDDAWYQPGVSSPFQAHNKLSDAQGPLNCFLRW
jgi:galactose oxidase